MLREPFFYLALLPIIVELVLIALRPTWFAPFAMWKVSEHSFTLRNLRRETGYRDGSKAAQDMPVLPARTEMSDAVLVSHAGKLVLRRAFFGGGRGRNMWLVPIDIVREGDSIKLVARQVFLPLTGLLAAPLMGYAITHDIHNWVAMLGMTGLLLVGFVVQLVFSLPGRNGALRESYSFIERELRQGLEVAQHPAHAVW